MQSEIEQREAEYTRLFADYQDLVDSPVFRCLEKKRIKPNQVTVDNSLKLFALELRLKALENQLSVMDPNFEFTTIFLGEMVFTCDYNDLFMGWGWRIELNGNSVAEFTFRSYPQAFDTLKEAQTSAVLYVKQFFPKEWERHQAGMLFPE